MAAENDEEIKRQVKELAALFTLEPKLKALFVEGAWDRRLLRWFFREVGYGDVQVSEITVVAFEKGQLEGLNLDSRSNKEKVIGLVRLLSTSIDVEKTRVYGLVDRDTENFIGFKWKSPRLLRTDYTSMELYFFDGEPIEKFIELVLHGFPMSAAKLLDRISPILESAFWARVANESLGFRCDWLDVSRCCQIKKNEIEFDLDDWLERYLNKCGQGASLPHFKKEMKKFEKRRAMDPRFQMHGHDFVDMLGWLILKLKNRFGLFRDRECLARALVGCTEAQFIEGERLFLELRQIFGP